LGEKRVSRNKVKNHIESNQQALDIYKKSYLGYYGGLGLSVISGVVVGTSVGTARADDESIDSAEVGGGLALFGLALFLVNRSEKYVRQGIDIFNSENTSLKPDSSRNRQVLTGVYLKDSQIGFSFHF